MNQHLLPAYRQLKELLAGISSSRLRHLGVEALRAWWQKQKPSNATDALEQATSRVFHLGMDLGAYLINAIAHDKQLPPQHYHGLVNAFTDDDALQTDWMGPVLELVWWLERAGLAVPLAFGKKYDPAYPSDSDQRWYPTSMRLTERGGRLLESSDENPLLPGFLDRVRARCPDLPEGAIALLVDARACLDRSLMRPAIVLMGVAYELVVERVIEILVETSVLTEVAREQPKQRIKRIKDLLGTEKAKGLLPHPDARTAAECAYDFAEALRQRRNDAAHTKPAFDFEQSEEAEEFLISAGRHLPALWSLAQ